MVNARAASAKLILDKKYVVLEIIGTVGDKVKISREARALVRQKN